jgi:predicted transcriptional regulator
MNDDQSISQSLPALERQVFEVVKRLGSASVADVAQELTGDEPTRAYTTVMTVLSRLFQKGYLLRQRDGKAYLYEAREADDIAEDLASRVARDAISRFGDLALSGFVQTLTPEQRGLLSQLLQDGAGATAGVADDE